MPATIDQAIFGKCVRALFTFAAAALLAVPLTTANAAPVYLPDTNQLDAMLADLKAWLPGEWNSFPHVWYDRNVSMPDAGEHEHWHRTFALIDAPQVGDTVFYGQINMGGKDGPIMARSQVLYKATIDRERGRVAIIGQPLADPERYANLHARPELWSQVSMRDEQAVNCVFIWHRNGRQLVGVLDSKDPAGRNNGPGTCSYTAANGLEFLADAEWVLSPDELWQYDINKMGGVQFVGRTDKTHTRLYRARDYRCLISAAEGLPAQTSDGHDRGFSADFEGADNAAYRFTLLRAWYPAATGGLTDELRLSAQPVTGGDTSASIAAPPGAPQVALSVAGRRILCTR